MCIVCVVMCVQPCCVVVDFTYNSSTEGVEKWQIEKKRIETEKRRLAKNRKKMLFKQNTKNTPFFLQSKSNKSQLFCVHKVSCSIQYSECEFDLIFVSFSVSRSRSRYRSRFCLVYIVLTFDNFSYFAIDEHFIAEHIGRPTDCHRIRRRWFVRFSCCLFIFQGGESWRVMCILCFPFWVLFIVSRFDCIFFSFVVWFGGSIIIMIIPKFWWLILFRRMKTINNKLKQPKNKPLSSDLGKQIMYRYTSMDQAKWTRAN